MANNSLVVTGPGPNDQGSGYRIGDGYVLTAGHVASEWDRSLPASSLSHTGITIALDYRNYETAYINHVNNTPNILNSTNLQIDGAPEIAQNDSIVISNSGNINNSDDGLVVFIDNNDLTDITTVLGIGASIFREAHPNGGARSTTSGSVTNIDPTLSGVLMPGVLRFSASSQPGESGGAYLLSHDGKDFVVGTHFGNVGSNALGTYFSYTEWHQLNDLLETGQSGNVTTSEPTNLIVGSDTDDASISGSFRADIILGRGGVDSISDGDLASDTVWADDELDGGAGNDTLIAASGNDSLSGGDDNDYLVADGAGLNATKAGADTLHGGGGVDTADYSSENGSVNTNVTFTDGGINGDGDQVINVTDTYGKSDTLISIEYLILNGAGDTVDLSTFTGSIGIDGGGGNDDLDGGSGNDSLFGGEGIDSVTGGAGNDLIGNIHAPTFDYASMTPAELQVVIDSEDNGVATTLSGGAGDDVYLIDYSSAFDPQVTHGGSDFSIDDTDAGTKIFVRDITTGHIDPMGGTIIPITISTPSVVSEIDIGDGEIVRCTQSASASTTFGFTGEESNAFYVIGNTEGSVTINGPEEHCGTSPPSGGGFDPGTTQLRITRFDSVTDFYQSGAGGGTGNTAQRIVINSTDLTFSDLVKGGRPDLGLDTISGGSGSEPSTSSGVLAMVTAGGYSVTGTAGDDFVFSITGTQDVDLLDGDDVSFTGDSNDTIDGGAGNDSLVGGGGDDDITGGSGADTVEGGDGLDTIRGGASGDALMGAAGNDSLLGEGGADTLEGGSGADTLKGGSGNDTVLGGADNDEIDGGGDNDVVFGEAGDDTLIGGAGGDTLEGGDGVDTADYSTATSGITLNIATGSHTGDASGDEFFDIEVFSGSGFADTFDGDAGVNHFLGGGGADTLRGEAGNDSLSGNAANDALYGGIGADFLDGGDGNDLVNGEDEADEMFGGLGDDTLNGGGNNDTIAGGSGADEVHGNPGADELFGGSGNDLLDGGDGLDTVSGADGDDELFGGSSADLLFGGNDNDTLAGGIGFDTLSGGNGNDQLFTGSGNDVALGDAGNDTLDGNTGSDTLDGGDGDDRILTGTGDDVILFEVGDDADTVTDFQAGAGSFDVIDLSGMGASFDTFAEVQNAASQVGSDTVIDFGGGDLITLINVNVSSLHQDDFVFT